MSSIYIHSGRAPAKLSLELLQQRGYTNDNPLPNCHALNVTVPGAAAGLVDMFEHFGSKKVGMITHYPIAVPLTL